MSTPLTLPWQEPLAFAPLLDAHQHAALLYSGTPGEKARYSYLCLGARQCYMGSDLATLKAALPTDGAWYEHCLVGWLGYGLKNQLEQLPEDAPAPIPTEDYCFVEPEVIYRFCHHSKQVECVGEHVLSDDWHAPPAPLMDGAVKALRSNMSKAAYLEHVQTILEAIRAGTCYQANLTRKFYGEFEAQPSAGGLFTKLCSASPANYSALIRAGDISVVSSSPELFLCMDNKRGIHTRPIKGTIGRGENLGEDNARKQLLAASEKDKAENLMIVDLMRNDLSRVCEAGSVAVDALFDITTHAHIHHMSSLVSGRLRAGAHPIDAVAACFPPGSMTGTPKIKAMEICSQLERQARGVYSGVLGWFGGDGSAHLSVVIRTLLLQGTQFEFQVGGGIVADSVAETEFEETMDKARGICEVLGIGMETLQNL